jgi:hypothetical protein
MLMSVTLVSAMICFQSFFALFDIERQEQERGWYLNIVLLTNQVLQVQPHFFLPI